MKKRMMYLFILTISINLFACTLDSEKINEKPLANSKVEVIFPNKGEKEQVHKDDKRDEEDKVDEENKEDKRDKEEQEENLGSHGEIISKKDMKTLINKVAETTFGRDLSNVGIYYYNLKTKEEVSINSDKYFMAASTVKIPLCMMILDSVQRGELSMDTKLKYNKKDHYEGGSGILQNEKNFKEVTVQRAIELAITHSDNIAYNMLESATPMWTREYVMKHNNNYNIPSESRFSPRQIGNILKRLYKNPDKNPYYEELIGYMTKTIYHDRLDKHLPYDKVAHKIGSFYRYYHDAGIIYGKEPYVLVVFTKDIGELKEIKKGDDPEEDTRNLLDWGNEAMSKIANFSKEVWNLSN